MCECRVRVCVPAPTRYLIGVASVTNAPTGADFVITALLSEGLTQLQDGIPVQDTVAAGSYRYYQLSIDEPRTDVSVALTNYFGNGRMYLSTTVHRPNNTWGGYTWRSHSYEHDMVYIQCVVLPRVCCACGHCTERV